MAATGAERVAATKIAGELGDLIRKIGPETLPPARRFAPRVSAFRASRSASLLQRERHGASALMTSIRLTPRLAGSKAPTRHVRPRCPHWTCCERLVALGSWR
jgi:hypothetical protein